MNTICACILLFTSHRFFQTDVENDLFHFSVLFSRAENTDEILSISNKIQQIDNRNQIREGNVNDVRLLKSEIDRFLLMDEKIKKEFITLKNNFKNVIFMNSRSDLEFTEKYLALLPIEKKISSVFGKESPITWIYSTGVLDVEGKLRTRKIKSGQIKDLIEGYKKKYGEESLMLCDLNWYLMKNLVRSGDYNGAIKMYKKTIELAARYTSQKSRRFYSTQIFAIKCYLEVGDSDEARRIFSSLDSAEVLAWCEGMPYELYLFNSSASIFSAINGKPDNAILFQESALIYLENAVDHGSPVLASEIDRLRDLFVKTGDWKSVGKLEEKYKLKPTPRKLHGS